MSVYSLDQWDGNYASSLSLKRDKTTNWGRSFLSPAPFGSGSMRFAWDLHTEQGLILVKRYN